jgi:hypothetical protein
MDLFQGKIIIRNEEYVNPEIPDKRKSKRSIDQIDPVTCKIIKSYDSIEEAGRNIGCTGSNIGQALRNGNQGSGFLWRYTGISHEDQFTEQPVFKICCKTGHKVRFNTIAAAARDANTSAPNMRNRINKEEHHNNHHWVFDKTAATHYVFDE